MSGTEDLANAIANLPPDQALHIIVDGDGTLAYQYVTHEQLAVPELARLELELLLKRREDIRADALGETEDAN